MKIKPFKLQGAVKDYIWGGVRLIENYGKKPQKTGAVVAESWELSAHKDGDGIIANGELAGKKFSEIANDREICGNNISNFEMFPILIKLIDSETNLSIQVHPSDEYALKNEGQYGKTEMWYIVSALPGAGIYYGFNRDVSSREYSQYIADGRVCELLNFIPVKAGETYFIESGTVHAICGGLTIWELQQNSNLTYRVFDYNRLGADGQPRELHVEKAVEVSNTRRIDPIPVKVTEKKGEMSLLCKCKYFEAYSLSVDGSYIGKTDADSFHCLTVVSGCGGLNNEMKLSSGDTIFIPANCEKYIISGNLKCLVAKI